MTHPGETAVARTVPLGTGPTLPHLLAVQARTQGAATALLHKRHGIWHRWTWQAAAQQVDRLAAAILAHGVQPGEAVPVAGASRPRLLLAVLACQQAGAVPVLVPQAGAGIGIDAALAEHRPSLVFAASEHEVYAIHALRGGLERPPAVVCDDARGLQSLRAPWLATFDAWLAAPATSGGQGGISEIAAIVYGNDDRSRELRHAELIATAEATLQVHRLEAADRGFVAVPLGWEAAWRLGPVLALRAGFALAFPENDATMLRDLREAGPSYLFGPPLLFRQLRQAAHLRATDAGWPWRGWLQRGFAPAPAGPFARAAARAAGERLGLSRVRTAICFGADVAPRVAEFLAALGIALAAPSGTGIEARLSGSAYIRHAFVVTLPQGEHAALLALDTDSVAQWARRHGAAVRSTADLATLDGVATLLAAELAACAGPHRITAFRIAPHGFDPRSGEIAADGSLHRAAIERLHAAALADLRAGGGIRVAQHVSPHPVPRVRHKAPVSPVTADPASA